MQEDFKAFRRFPTVEKSIGDIGPEDGRVSFVGTVVSANEGKLVVDDGTGSIEIITDGAELKTGKLVRIVGKIDQEGALNAEAVQDFSGFNLDLYRKIKGMEKGKSI